MIPAASRQAIDDADVALSDGLRDALARRRRLRMLAILAARSADSWVCAAVLLGLWKISDPILGRQALRLLAATVATGIAVRVMKRLVRRDRPASEWGDGYRRVDPHSFPSGHAARVGVIAAFGTLVLPAWAGLALLVWAGAVAAARVGLGVHYVSDVVAGLALGGVVGVLTAVML